MGSIQLALDALYISVRTHWRQVVEGTQVTIYSKLTNNKIKT